MSYPLTPTELLDKKIPTYFDLLSPQLNNIIDGFIFLNKHHLKKKIGMDFHKIKMKAILKNILKIVQYFPAWPQQPQYCKILKLVHLLCCPACNCHHYSQPGSIQRIVGNLLIEK